MFGFKNKRKVPEEFSDELLKVVETRRKLKQNEERFMSLLREIQRIRASCQSSKEDLAEIKEMIWEIQAKISRPETIDKHLEETLDVSQRIKELLLEKGKMSFSELLNSVGVVATTLSKYLNRLVQENRIERIESGRNVFYKLKGDVFYRLKRESPVSGGDND